MRKKTIGLKIFLIGLLSFGLAACKNIDNEADKIITPTPQAALVINQADANMITTVNSENMKEMNTTDITENLKEPKSPTYIPESLLTFIENSMKKGNARNAFSSIVSDKKLSNHEINNLSHNKVLDKYVGMVKASTGTVLQVDADNDGIQDLYFLIEDGGSMGNSSRYLLKGNANGTYSMTDSSYAEVTQELAFINFEEKNYLLQTTFDYNHKIYNGFEISCFINGKVHERIFLSKDAVKYKVNIILKDKSLKRIAKRCEKIGRDQYAYHIRYLNYKIKGSAEKSLKKNEIKNYANEDSYPVNSNAYYKADINNDGKEEIYNKEIFFSSTRSTLTHLEYELCNRKGKDMINNCLHKFAGCPQMFWIERSKHGNIICILSLDNLLDYTIYGFSITKDTAKEVFRNTFIGNMKIDRTIYTAGINLEKEW